jgi:hypothetical protein
MCLIKYCSPRVLLALATLSAQAYSQQPADFGSWVAEAFAKCQSGTQSSCKVELTPNHVYTYANTITIPALASSGITGGYPILEGNGATLVYTGTGDALYIAPRFNSQTMSGAIRDLTITTSNASATPMHTQSIIGFHVENVSLIGTGTNAACLKMENTAVNGLELWSEWNRFVISTIGCVKGVQLLNAGGQPSFLYNDWQIFDRIQADQIGFSVEGAIGTPGSSLVIGANTYGTPGHLAHLISATGGAQASFVQLVIRGESDNSVVDCSTFVDSTSFISAGLGSHLGANFIPCNNGVSSQVEINANINPGYTNLQGRADVGAEFQAGFYSRNYPQKTNCKTHFLSGAMPGDNASMVFGLADPAGWAGPNCYFEIYKRVTSDADPEVNVPGASNNPIQSAFFVDSYTGGVGIGPGFGWNGSSFVLPQKALHVVGGTFSDFYTGPDKAPSGSCSTVGWVFSQDGHATFCNGSYWVIKI